MPQDMKTTPRVRALFDFFIEELNTVRPILAGEESGRFLEDKRGKPGA